MTPANLGTLAGTVFSHSDAQTSGHGMIGAGQQSAEQHVCPSCGYCPCCGRRNIQYPPVDPWYPVPYYPLYTPIWVIPNPPMVTYSSLYNATQSS